ncbi:hypothetical protein [Sporosarcina sp. YIM B06819]|uniref:hypothetical protein n=1 Tax=Sporosarcina sp. YIM B06819 TaxID=3081769 RepID=UPI00298BCB21|nr:hypothetical protein [Sporosarcina sp. YIM B06819]
MRRNYPDNIMSTDNSLNRGAKIALLGSAISTFGDALQTIGGAISIEEGLISDAQQQQELDKLQKQIDELKKEQSNNRTNPDVEMLGKLLERLVDRLDREDDERKKK